MFALENGHEHRVHCPRTPTRTANSEVPQLMARTMRYPWLLLKCWLTDTAELLEQSSGSARRAHSLLFRWLPENPDIDDVDLPWFPVIS